MSRTASLGQTSPGTPPEIFPAPDQADENGLLLVGGELNALWLQEAYYNGIFPWPVLLDDDHTILAWFSPDPRAVLDLHGLHVSRRLARRIRQPHWQISCNQQFRRVVEKCAHSARAEPGTWITAEIMEAYCQFHDLGRAHSVEVYQDGQLVGGLYGVTVGAIFAGESMFHLRTDASKIALVYLVHHLRAQGFRLFDIQQSTDHMCSLGAHELPRSRFLDQVYRYRHHPVEFGSPDDFARNTSELSRAIQPSRNG